MLQKHTIFSFETALMSFISTDKLSVSVALYVFVYLIVFSF